MLWLPARCHYDYCARRQAANKLSQNWTVYSALSAKSFPPWIHPAAVRSQRAYLVTLRATRELKLIRMKCKVGKVHTKCEHFGIS